MIYLLDKLNKLIYILLDIKYLYNKYKLYKYEKYHTSIL
jgi:hypothetical protein